MLGLIGTVGGAVALEIRRIRKKGGPEEVKELKQKEQALLRLLETTNQELERAKHHSEAAEERAQKLEQDKEQLEQQKEQLQHNNTKLVLTNVMLLNKAKHLEDSSRTLVAKQEDLQHQLEQLQREKQADAAASQASLAALKDQVTGVLNRYLSKDIDLQQALHEMQAMGIELVPLDPTAEDGPSNAVDFETKLVLDSPHRMQRLMSAAAGKLFQLPAAYHTDSDVPMMSLPLGITKDPNTGLPRISLGWRSEPQFASSACPSLTSAAESDQHAASDQTQAASLALQDSSSIAAAGSIKVAAVSSDGKGGEALTFTASAQKQKTPGSFSFGFGSIGRISSGGSSKSSSDGLKAGPSKVPVVPSAMLKGSSDDDLTVASSRELARI